MSKLTRYAWVVLVFNVFTILLGAVVRATGSGAGCGPSWPTCKGQLVPELEGATAVEFSHRVISGIALVLVVILAVGVWRTIDKGGPARVGSLLALVAIVGEALIGALIVLAEWVADDSSTARAIAVPLHLVNTLFLLAALSLTVFWLSGGRRLDFGADRMVTRAVIFGGSALVLIAATGAITALADTLFPGESLDADFSRGAHFLTRLRIIHPVLAITSAAIGWWVSGRSVSPRSWSARWLPILVGLMLLSGALNVLLGVPVWMQILHLALADTLWIAYVFTSAQALQVQPAAAVAA
jgi:heme A synthase